MLERFFRLRENKTNIRTEVIAGFTTFMTMAYVLILHPSILSDAGMNKEAMFTVTALAAVAGTLLMAFLTNLPFALAPGMGLNAFFTYTVVIQMNYHWQVALTAVFIEGIIFIVLTAFNIREAIINSIPLSIKHAISVGIGLFIALIGLQHAEIIKPNEETFVMLGDMSNHKVWIALSGFLVMGVFLVLRVKGALLLGIITAAIAGVFLGETTIPTENLIGLPPDISPVFFKLDFRQLLKADIIIVVFTFLFVDMFDTVGTLVGVSSKAKMLDKGGNVPKAKQALFADSIATTLGALLGTSTVTTYVESAAGVTEGGKTGLTGVVVAFFFLLTLFFSGIFLMIPVAAGAPALIMIGLFMMSPVQNINMEDYSEAIPVFLTIIMMPFTFSISEGITFGILSYVIIKVLTGKFRKVSIVLYILSVFFLIKFFMK